MQLASSQSHTHTHTSIQIASQLGAAHIRFGGLAGKLHVHRGRADQFPNGIELGVVFIPNQVEDNALTGGYHATSLTEPIQGQVSILIQARGAAVGHDVDVDVLLQKINSSLLHAYVGLLENGL